MPWDEPAEFVLTITSVPAESKQTIALALKRSRTLVGTATIEFAPSFSERDRDDLRWYLEDYFQWQDDPAPRRIARFVERRMTRLGNELFEKLFLQSSDSRAVWQHIKDDLAKVRLELSLDGTLATVPWELMREPSKDALALQTSSFVRIYPSAPKTDARPPDRLRVLLIISRPSGPRDVPFRSIGRHLVRLAQEHGQFFSVDVLRPPTFDSLGLALQSAAREGRPYNLLHFDGHGVFGALGGGLSGERGYLAFESDREGPELVDGTTLGQLLVSAELPFAVLNACESAATSRVARAYGAVADELVAAGVSNVVAMRYKIYVSTAAQFISQLYADLAAGIPLDKAVARGRRALAADLERPMAGATNRLMDWIVPVQYECADGTQAAPRAGSLRPAKRSISSMPSADTHVGRDSVLLQIDRAFDRYNSVLLHGLAGVGKTCTASAFARWYVATKGAVDSVISDALGGPIERPLRNALWVVDGLDRASSPDMINALQEASANGTKVLATSRRAEPFWQDQKGVVIALPVMQPAEVVDLWQVLLLRHGATPTDFSAWHNALEYSAGIPGVLTALIATILQDGSGVAEATARVIAQAREGSSPLSSGLEFHLEGAFNEAELRHLGLLAFFDLIVGRADLEYMTARLASTQSRIAPITKEQAGIFLARLGPLGAVYIENGGSFFSLHPLFPGICRRFLEDVARAERAFAEGIAQAAYFFSKGVVGDAGYLQLLKRYERNMLLALRILKTSAATDDSFWPLVGALLAGLGPMYSGTGRSEELLNIVSGIRQAGAREEPRPMQRVLAQLESNALRAVGKPSKADAIERELLEEARWVLDRVGPSKNEPLPPGVSDELLRLTISTMNYASTLRERGDPASAGLYFKALGWSRRLRDANLESEILLRLGELFSSWRDKSKRVRAEILLRRSLLLQETPSVAQRQKTARFLAEILLARARNTADSERKLALIKEAGSNAELAYNDRPPGAAAQASIGLTLGSIYRELPGKREQAFAVLREALISAERANEPALAAAARLEIAELLLTGARLHDGLEFARAALRTFRAQQEDERIDAAIAVIRKFEAILARTNDAVLNDWLNLVSSQYTIAMRDDPLNPVGVPLAEQEELGSISFTIEGYSAPIAVTLNRKERSFKLSISLMLGRALIPQDQMFGVLAKYLKSDTFIATSVGDISLQKGAEVPEGSDFMQTFNEAVVTIDHEAQEFEGLIDRFTPRIL